jgi:hypothetical protein
VNSLHGSDQSPHIKAGRKGVLPNEEAVVSAANVEPVIAVAATMGCGRSTIVADVAANECHPRRGEIDMRFERNARWG